MKTDNRFADKDFQAVLGILARSSQEIKSELVKSHKKLLKKDLKFVLKRPENQIFNVLTFLQIQALRNKYQNKHNEKQFMNTARKSLGLVYFSILKAELKQYQNIFDDAVKSGLNPLEEVSIDLYQKFTGSSVPNLLATTIISTYLVSVGNLWKQLEELKTTNKTSRK